MAKIKVGDYFIECENPNDLESLEKAFDEAVGKCNITYFKQHQEMVNAGISKSIRESSKIIAEDTGESPESVRCRIRRGKKEVGHHDPLKSKVSENIDDTPKILENRIPQGGGHREGAGRPPKSVFNITNQNVDWAKWTWNPITGCKHGCPYCYARDIANRFKENFPKGFEPHFRERRLKAPENTKVGKDENNGVFVCSMSDMFGDWVSDEWIRKILKVCYRNTQWRYIFLTKNPKRYQDFNPWPDNCLVGATVDVQDRVKQTEDAFENIEAKYKFISCEPLSEELTFNKINLFYRVIIGARSKTANLPAMKPKKDWVMSLTKQAWESGIDIYCKPNALDILFQVSL